MQQPDRRLEEIKILENANSISTTREFIGNRKITYDKDAIQFRPGKSLKIFALAFGCSIPAIILWRVLAKKPLTSSELKGMIGSAIVGLIILFNAIRQFTSKKMNFAIRIDRSGISIYDTLYSWNDIYETAILTSLGGSSQYFHLIIALKGNSSYENFDLTNFQTLIPSGFAITLSKYIEHFKPSLPPTIDTAALPAPTPS